MHNPFQKVPALERLSQAKAETEPSFDVGLARLITKFNKAVKKHDLTAASHYKEQIQLLFALKMDALAVLATEECQTALRALPTVTYLVGVQLLQECFEYLTQDSPEWMLAVTGLQYDSIFTLNQTIPLELSHQSVTRATASGDSLTQVLLDLDKQGYALHAIFHSHRFRGVPHPSSVDIDLQKNIIEAAGYPAVQAVFSEDGYIRFFSYERRFQIAVYGKGVEEVGQQTYHLTQVS